MDLPSLPDDEAETSEPTTISSGAKWVIAAVVALVVAMIVLHLTGVLGQPKVHG